MPNIIAIGEELKSRVCSQAPLITIYKGAYRRLLKSSWAISLVGYVSFTIPTLISTFTNSMSTIIAIGEELP